MQTYDVVVLGIGGMGSAACAHLAARGARVLGLERFTLPHTRGSSHGQTRLIRQAYMEGEGYVPLALRAYALWDALGERHGAALLHRTGILYLGSGDSPTLASVEQSADLHGLALERFDADAVASEFPDFRLMEGGRGVLEVAGGYLDVEACVAAHAVSACEDGADLREQAEVTGWIPKGEGVEVSFLEEGRPETVAAGSLVVTAGAWTGPLLVGLGLPLSVHRVVLPWFRPEPGAHGPGSPCFLVDLPEGHFYGVPALAPWGVKLARHAPGPPVEDPMKNPPEVAPEELAAVHRARERCFPRLDPEPTHTAACLYTMTPDEHFVIDRHPEFSQVAFAAGFSGHGFKFASVVGEVLADLALEGTTRHPIDFLGAARFS